MSEMKPKKKVEIYWNLHKDMWSVREAHGRVLTHTDYIVMHNVDWVVQQAGRRRVLKEGKKNVHAFGRGYIGKACPKYIDHIERVKYNPYRDTSFRATSQSDLNRPIYRSDWAVFSIEKGIPHVQSMKEWERTDDLQDA